MNHVIIFMKIEKLLTRRAQATKHQIGMPLVWRRNFEEPSAHVYTVGVALEHCGLTFQTQPFAMT